jgi:hypothetical protein
VPSGRRACGVLLGGSEGSYLRYFDRKPVSRPGWNWAQRAEVKREPVAKSGYLMWAQFGHRMGTDIKKGLSVLR